MTKSSLWFAACIIMVLLWVHLGGCAKVSIKGEPPQYTGLSETQPGPVVIPAPGPKAEGQAPQKKPPVIKSAYAIDRGRYGLALKIYIEAEDPDGDMAQIATTVVQVGYGYYPSDFIILKPQYGKYFKGYLQWNTLSSRAAFLDDWTILNVRVAFLDKAVKWSNEFEFPFTFMTGLAPAPNPPAPFDRGDLVKLGDIAIQLFNPRFMGGGENRH